MTPTNSSKASARPPSFNTRSRSHHHQPPFSAVRQQAPYRTTRCPLPCFAAAPPPPSSPAPSQDVEDKEDKEEKPQAMAASPPPPPDVVAVRPFFIIQPLEGDMATDGSNSIPLPNILKASIHPGIASVMQTSPEESPPSSFLPQCRRCRRTPMPPSPRASAQVDRAALLLARSTKPLPLPTMPSEPSIQPPSAVMPRFDRCLHRIASPPPSIAAPSHDGISSSVPAIVSPFTITDAPPEPERTTSPAPPLFTRPDPRATVFLPSDVPGRRLHPQAPAPSRSPAKPCQIPSMKNLVPARHEREGTKASTNMKTVAIHCCQL